MAKRKKYDAEAVKQAAAIVPGQRFGYLVTIGQTIKVGSRARLAWVCKCDCGLRSVVLVENLRRGGSTSCGCSGRKFNATDLPEYAVWSAMKCRCKNPRDRRFKDYGGRGIRVCRRWESFENFIADMGRRPSPDHTLERVRNNCGYSPSNCCWAKRKQQQRNMRRNRIILFRGKKKTLVEWSEYLGIRPNTIACRLSRGWSIERALTTR